MSPKLFLLLACLTESEATLSQPYGNSFTEKMFRDKKGAELGQAMKGDEHNRYLKDRWSWMRQEPGN
jgi:hypothetical protein